MVSAPAKDGSAKDYDFGQKNHWRRTIWNEILRRTKGREKSEVILYLSGPKDLDRAIAISKGVPPLNLIAVDRKLDSVESVRSLGGGAIRADAYEVLRAWPAKQKVCAIFLDFCQGFQRLDLLRDILVYHCTSHPAMKESTVALNMQRGRDEESGLFRSRLDAFITKHGINTLAMVGDVYPEPLRSELDKILREHSDMFSVDNKHRGLAFSFWYMCQFLDPLSESFRAMLQMANPPTVALMIGLFGPKLFSYRSGALVFDSVVINPAGSLFDLQDCQQNDAILEPIRSKVKRKIALSINATMAVRTKRLRAAVAVDA